MTRRSRSALGADALRGLLGAEDLASAPTSLAAPEGPPDTAPPPKRRKTRKPAKRRSSRKRAPAVQAPAPEPDNATTAEPAAADTTTASEPTRRSASARRTRRTNVQGYIDAAVLDRARNAAFWTPGVSLSALIEQGLCSEIARLEAERGDPFPPRSGPLTPGPSVR